MVPDLDCMACEMLSARDEGRQLAPRCSPASHLELEDAYRLGAIIRALREARGERVAGRKIGFTNRTIWPQYKVYAPIWGYIYDNSVFDLAGGGASSRVEWAFEPRIEPEIVFRLAEAPVPGMNERDLLGCVEWVAHGFEIVESIFPGWIFTAPCTVAGFGLHRALLTGPKHSVRSDPEGWLAALSSFEIELMCNGAVADRGHARNVLGGPLSTLIHLMDILQLDSANPVLSAGEVITTGTLTAAMPVSRGDVWSTALTGIELEGASIRFD